VPCQLPLPLTLDWLQGLADRARWGGVAREARSLEVAAGYIPEQEMTYCQGYICRRPSPNLVLACISILQPLRTLFMTDRFTTCQYGRAIVLSISSDSAL